MRPTRKWYFMKIAEIVSQRGTCSRLKVGAVLVKDNRIIATGYNGAPSGKPHCNHVSQNTFEGINIESENVVKHCEIALHAEISVLLMCARHGTSTDNTIIYITHSPCGNCIKALVQAGVKEVFFKEAYKLCENKFTDYIKINDEGKKDGIL